MSNSLGYNDTPILPDSGYHVHDGDRPQPPVVDPGPVGGPTSDAYVLLHGGDLTQWKGRDGGPCPWKLENGYMEVAPGTGDVTSIVDFGDMQLHLEFASPWEVRGSGQYRGNSGIFLMDQYEIQVLDGFDNPTYPDGLTGAIYGQYPPLVNACRRPGEWQSLDIVWVAPRFEGETVVSPAYVTILQNGVVLHHHKALMGATGHRNIPGYTPHPPRGPIRLQDHGDLVRYRNIWVRELRDYDLK